MHPPFAAAIQADDSAVVMAALLQAPSDQQGALAMELLEQVAHAGAINCLNALLEEGQQAQPWRSSVLAMVPVALDGVCFSGHEACALRLWREITPENAPSWLQRAARHNLPGFVRQVLHDAPQVPGENRLYALQYVLESGPDCFDVLWNPVLISQHAAETSMLIAASRTPYPNLRARIQGALLLDEHLNALMDTRVWSAIDILARTQPLSPSDRSRVLSRGDAEQLPYLRAQHEAAVLDEVVSPPQSMAAVKRPRV